MIGVRRAKRGEASEETDELDRIDGARGSRSARERGRGLTVVAVDEERALCTVPVERVDNFCWGIMSRVGREWKEKSGVARTTLVNVRAVVEGERDLDVCQDIHENQGSQTYSRA